MACSNIRYGYGVTQEVGMDFANMKAKKVGVYTDKNVAQLPAMKVAIDSLTKAGVKFEVFDDVRVEPTDTRYASIQLPDVDKGGVTKSKKFADIIFTCPISLIFP